MGRWRASLQQDSGAQASMMAVDNASGEVLAMVGGTGFCAVAVQSGDAGAAAGGVVVQAVCVYDGDGGGGEADGHYCGWADDVSYAEWAVYAA